MYNSFKMAILALGAIACLCIEEVILSHFGVLREASLVYLEAVAVVIVVALIRPDTPDAEYVFALVMAGAITFDKTIGNLWVRISEGMLLLP